MLYEISEKAIQLENQGKKMIKFNLGDPDMSTPPEIIAAAYEAMKQGKTKYSSAAGELKLREELASIHDVSADNVQSDVGVHGQHHRQEEDLDDEEVGECAHWPSAIGYRFSGSPR